LYLELGLLKEGHGTLKASCAITERAVSGDLTALDKKVADLDSEVRSLRAMMKADNQESVEKVTSSDLSKEVITALVTEVILSDTIERRNRDLAEVAEVISTKQMGQVAALGEESESRISAQLQALKKDFDQAMEVMAKKLAQKEAEAESSKAQISVDAEQWRDKADQRIVEFQQQTTQQSAESVALIQQLRVDLEKKSSELAAAVAALAEKNEKAVTSSATAASDAKAIEKEQADSAAAALQVLQKEMLKVSGKVGEAQTALAKMNVQSMHLQDAVTSSSTTAKESHVLVADLAITVEKLEKRHTESAAQAAGASRDEAHEQFKRLEDRIDAVASSVSTPRKDADSSTENRVQTVAEQHSKLAAELDSLRLCFQKAEKDHLIAMTQTNSTLKK
jgi:DNA repair exonuclease SbcCD ATPase subunit